MPDIEPHKNALGQDKYTSPVDRPARKTQGLLLLLDDIRNLAMECQDRSNTKSSTAAVTDLSTADSPNSIQWATLALIRFILAADIMVGHSYVCMNPGLPEIGSTGAVLGFLIISGYSIAASISKDHYANGFYVRRIRRIFPLSTCSLLLTLVPLLLLSKTTHLANGELATFPTLLQFTAGIIQLQGIIVPNNMFDAPLWSLSVECFYYWLTPLFRAATKWVLLGLIAISFSVALYNFRAYIGSFFNMRHGYAELSCLYVWLAGFFFYRFRTSRAAIAVLLLPSSIYIWHSVHKHILDDNAVLIVGTTLALLYGRSLRLSRALASLCNYLGEISYPLYITHWPVYMIMLAVFTRFSAPNGFRVLAFIPSILVAVALYHLVDLPIRKYKFAQKDAPV